MRVQNDRCHILLLEADDVVIYAARVTGFGPVTNSSAIFVRVLCVNVSSIRRPLSCLGPLSNAGLHMPASAPP